MVATPPQHRKEVERRSWEIMQKSKLVRKGRKGFTLVEVALAVAVGLIIIGGVIVGYNAVKDNAAGSAARDKVSAAVGQVENYASANNQTYPASKAAGGTFTTLWDKARTDYASNPWGGATKNTTGVKEYDAAAWPSAAASGATAMDSVAKASDGIGDILYYTTNTPATPWGSVTDASNSTSTTVKNYVVSLFDKDGNPWWYVRGGS